MIKVTEIPRWDVETRAAWIRSEAISVITPYREGSSILVSGRWMEIAESPEQLRLLMIREVELG